MPTAITAPNLLVDPGYLFWAPTASTLPANTVTGSKFTDAWPVAWLQLGATVEGSTLSYEINVEAITVAELFDPVSYRTTARTGTFTFALAEWSLTNPEAGHEWWHNHPERHWRNHHEHVCPARAGRGGAGHGRLGVVRRDRAGCRLAGVVVWHD
jgi:hypothetical protein